MGFLEAAVLVYLRALTHPDLFPLKDALLKLGPRLGSVETTRQLVAPLALLAPALLLNRTLPVRAALYVLTFAAWILASYGFLWLFLRWPGNLFTYDVLYLFPRPWIAPVICPLAVAALLVTGASLYLYWARNRQPRMPGLFQSLALGAGALLLVLSFLWESDYYLRGGLPPRFAWGLFLGGYALALLGTVHLLYAFAKQEKARFF
jgi:hypothetical protein